MSENQNIIPTSFVIFGATGDLFQRKLAPALLNLFATGRLPKFFRILAFSRRPWQDDEFRAFLREALKEKISEVGGENIDQFLDQIFYLEGAFDRLSSYHEVAKLLARFDEEAGVCMNKLLYLATPPSFYELILFNISGSGLAIPCAPAKDGNDTGWVRVLIEKPFGKDAKNAHQIELMLAKLFSESQIFRIDHYLAKDTLQNILTFRFANGIFEPFWNKRFIDRIEVKLFEKGGVGSRGALYDGLGALRDVGQNHMLQMTALIAMENPQTFETDTLRKVRADTIKRFRIFKGAGVLALKRGQYEGFRSEPGVIFNSKTETYFKVGIALSATRWRGVPFILESGKCLPESKVEIVVHFKIPPEVTVAGERIWAEKIIFKIQPQEAITVICRGRNPSELSVTPSPTPSQELSLDKETNNNSSGKPLEAYERVLLDAVRGDQTLFASTEEVKAEWKIIGAILRKWGETELVKYPKGTIPKN